MTNPNAERAGRDIAQIVHDWFDRKEDLSTTEAFALIVICLREHGMLFPEHLGVAARPPYSAQSRRLV